MNKDVKKKNKKITNDDYNNDSGVNESFDLKFYFMTSLMSFFI